MSAGGATCTREGSITIADDVVRSNAYVVPSVAHSPGAFSTTFRSDVQAVNLAAAPASLLLTFTPAGTAPLSRTATLPARGILPLRDVLSGPDGFLYFCTNNRDGRGSPAATDDRILRIVPAS